MVHRETSSRSRSGGSARGAGGTADQAVHRAARCRCAIQAPAVLRRPPDNRAPITASVGIVARWNRCPLESLPDCQTGSLHYLRDAPVRGSRYTSETRVESASVRPRARRPTSRLQPPAQSVIRLDEASILWRDTRCREIESNGVDDPSRRDDREGGLDALFRERRWYATRRLLERLDDAEVLTDDHVVLPEDCRHHSRDIFILGGQNACTGLEQLGV
jgi:hypothetical protein